MGFNSGFKGLKTHSAWVPRRTWISTACQYRKTAQILGTPWDCSWLIGASGRSFDWSYGHICCMMVEFEWIILLSCLFVFKHVSRWFQRSELRVLLRASHMQPYEFSITKFEPPCWKLSDYLSSLHILQGDQKVSVHVMITIQKVRCTGTFLSPCSIARGVGGN